MVVGRGEQAVRLARVCGEGTALSLLSFLQGILTFSVVSIARATMSRTDEGDSSIAGPSAPLFKKRSSRPKGTSTRAKPANNDSEQGADEAEFDAGGDEQGYVAGMTVWRGSLGLV